MARRADAADRVLEQRVAGEDVAAVDEQGEHAAGVAGRVQGRDGQPADRERLVLVQVAGRAVDELALGRVDQHRRVREAVDDLGELGHVVVVVVGEQHVRDRDPLPLRLVEQRPHRPARVDEEPVPARPRGDEVGVGEPVRVHRALDDHRSGTANG